MLTTVKVGTDINAGGLGTHVTYDSTNSPGFMMHQDDVSTRLAAAGAFVCGPRSYTVAIVSPPAGGTTFMTVDEDVPSVSIMTSSDNDIGSFQI